MRIAFLSILLFSSTIFGQTKQEDKVIKYVIIIATDEYPGDINQEAIDSLDEPLKAIVAYYSALGGSNCQQDTNFVETCELTSALGLGIQGSDKHTKLIKDWFLNDRVAEELVKQNCFLGISGASFFSDYAYLYLLRQGNIVTVNYKLMFYERGKTFSHKGPDKIIIKGHQLKFLKRSKWQTI